MAERINVAETFIREGNAVKRVIGYADIANSTWYSRGNEGGIGIDSRHNNKGRPQTEYSRSISGAVIPNAEIISALTELRRQMEFVNAGGYRKLSYYLRRYYGYIVNRKKVYRLCKENGLLLPLRKKKIRHPVRISRNRVITGSDQLWEIDLKYGYIHGENRFFFILIIIDVFCRRIVNYHIGLRCLAEDLVFTLKIAIAKYGIDGDGLVIRTDRGSQMTSNAFFEYITAQKEDGLIHELIPPATPNKNAHVEAFNSILEVEYLQVRYFWTYGQAYAETVDFIDKYNTYRIHGSLGYRTPYEVYDKYAMGIDLGLKEVRV